MCEVNIVMYSGSKSRGRGLLFGVGSGLGINISGTSPSGFRVFLRKSLGLADVGVGSGSAFRGQIGFGDQTFGDVPLGFWVPDYITRLDKFIQIT